MKTFILTGPLQGQTTMVASWQFTNGKLELPDEERALPRVSFGDDDAEGAQAAT